MGNAIAQLTMVRAIVLGFLFAGLYRFFIYDDGSSKVMAIAASRTNLKTMQGELRMVDGKLDRAHEYQRSAAEMGEALNKLLSYLPDDFRLQDFMKEVSEEAKIAGLNILRVTDVKTQGKARKDFEELSVTVDLQGTFAQQLTFLSNLTKQKQIFTLDRFKIEKASSGVELDVPSVTLKGDIRAFRYSGAKAKL